MTCPGDHTVAGLREVDADGIDILPRFLLRGAFADELDADDDLTICALDDADLAEAVVDGELGARPDIKFFHDLPPILFCDGCGAHGAKAHEQQHQHSFHDSSLLWLWLLVDNRDWMCFRASILEV